MTKIRDDVQEMRNAALKKRKYIDDRQEEIEKLDKAFKAKELSLKKENAARIAELRSENKTVELDELARHQKQLSEYKENTFKQQQQLDKQRQQIHSIGVNRIQNTQEFNQDRLRKNHEMFQEKFNDLTDKSQTYLNELNLDLTHTKNMKNLEADLAIKQNNYKNENKIHDKQKLHDAQLQYNKELHSKELAFQINEHKKKIADTDRLQMHIQKTKDEEFARKLGQQRKHQAQRMKQEQENFSHKYKQLLKYHEQAINNLTEASNKHIAKIKLNNAQMKQYLDKRIDDEFYQAKMLNPKVVERPQEYVIELEVAPHEKDNIILHGDGRELRISFTRRTTAEVVDNDQSINRTKRSETYMKKIPVNDIVDASKIKEKYEDGVLTFIINKA